MKDTTKLLIIAVFVILIFGTLYIYREKIDNYLESLEPEQNQVDMVSMNFSGLKNEIIIDCEWIAENPLHDLIVNQSKASELCKGVFPELFNKNQER